MEVDAQGLPALQKHIVDREAVSALARMAGLKIEGERLDKVAAVLGYLTNEMPLLHSYLYQALERSDEASFPDSADLYDAGV